MKEINRPNETPVVSEGFRKNFCNTVNVNMDDYKDKLNLASGTDYLDGWINLDGCQDVKADVYCNLDAVDVKLPFEDQSLDLIYASHILEHIWYLPQLKKEMARVLRPNGCVCVVVPQYQSVDAWGDDTHCRAFSIASFSPQFWPKFHNITISEYDIPTEAERMPNLRWIVAFMWKVSGE